MTKPQSRQMVSPFSTSRKIFLLAHSGHSLSVLRFILFSIVHHHRISFYYSDRITLKFCFINLSVDLLEKPLNEEENEEGNSQADYCSGHHFQRRMPQGIVKLRFPFMQLQQLFYLFSLHAHGSAYAKGIPQND